jgi:hypothetical protein
MVPMRDRSTHLDPVNNVASAVRLQEELLALGSYADHVLALDVVRRETALRVLKRILLDHGVVLEVAR